MLANKINLCSFWALCLWFGLCSCAGDTVYLTIEDLPEISTPDDTSDYSTLYFTAAVGGTAFDEDAIDTRSFFQGADTIPLPKGRVVSLYIYKGNKTPANSTYLYYGKYNVEKAGFLTPIYANPSLPPGNYNLYAVSELNNTSDKTPNFYNGTGRATGLYNGLDYLWWSMQKVHVLPSTPQTIPILFAHESTEIMVNFEMDGCEIDTIYQATVNYPTTSACVYQLATGKISPSTNITTFSYFNLNISQTVGFVNFVPFKGDVFDAISGIGGQVHAVACGADQGWQTFT